MDPNRSQSAWILNRYAALVSVYSYVKGYSLAECQRLGNLTGAINTTAAGGIGAFTDKNEIEKRALEIFGQTIQL